MRCMALNPILTNIESSFHILVCWQFGHYLVIIFMKLNEILCNVIKLWFQKMAKIRDLLHDMKCCEMLLSEFKSRLPHQRNSIKFAFHCKLYRVIYFLYKGQTGEPIRPINTTLILLTFFPLPWCCLRYLTDTCECSKALIFLTWDSSAK